MAASRYNDTDTLVTATRKGDRKYWLSNYDWCALARCPSTVIVDKDTVFDIVSSVKHLSNKLGELRSECKRLALVFKVASRHWIAMLIIRQESSEWRSYVTDSLGPWWYSQFEDATLAMTELLTYLPKMDSMVNVSVKQLFDGWNCGLYTLMNLRILIASLKKGVEPGFGILPPVANERSFFWEMCQHSAYEMKALL
ncbi:hypothetical protein TKK_0005290 [Trichogramma kaykai]